MPCNFLSVARAKIDAKFGAELMSNPDALAVLVRELTPLMGKTPEVIRERDGSIYLRGDRTNLRISADEIRAMDVWTTKSEMATMVEKATEIVAALATASATERTVRGLAKRYGQFAITEDRRMGQGRRVKIRVPL